MDAAFGVIALAVFAATVGLLLTRRDPTSRLATASLMVAVGGIAVLVLAAVVPIVVFVLTNPSD